MRIQITKCKDEWWYKDKIGKSFIVFNDPADPEFYLLTDDPIVSIYKTDCIILNDDDHMPPHLRELNSFDNKENRPKTAQELIAQECIKIKDILIDKNRKYGNSAIEPCRVFSNASPLEQINVRLDDKLSRLMSGQADEDEDVELDIIGYLVLKRVAKKM